jgi:hypothetical protein
MFMTRLVAVLLVAGPLLVPGHAQVRVSSVPISRDTITLRLQTEGAPSEVTVQNGGLARIARNGGPAIALIPVLKGEAVELMVAEILTDPTTGNEGARQVARVTLVPGTAVAIDASPLPLEVELLRTAPPAALSQEPAGPCTVCCVTCGDYTTCACLVITECGWCCCPGACLCPTGKSGTTTCQAGANRLVAGGSKALSALKSPAEAAR